MSEPVPFHLDIPEAELDELRSRLRAARWPERELVADWSQGTPLSWVQEMCAYWADGYDWRRCEARLNGLGQHVVHVDGHDIHALHVESPSPHAVPLVLTHGWPGSVVEFLDVIGPLTDPAAHGGDPADAFHVVVPSLPGYGLSSKPTSVGTGTARIADLWVELMASFGYDRFGAQGGDWGAVVTTCLGAQHPDRLIGIHLNMPLGRRDREVTDLTEAEQRALAEGAEHREWGTGYSKQQSTRPQTIGYSLVDSPVGLAGWILEKFHAWTDCGGHPENVLTKDQLLDNLMLYWLPATGASAARLYWESFRQIGRGQVAVPTGCSLFPHEIARPSRRWAEVNYSNIVYWNELDRGGHFAAFEQPTTFVDEVRAAFRLMR